MIFYLEVSICCYWSVVIHAAFDVPIGGSLGEQNDSLSTPVVEDSLQAEADGDVHHNDAFMNGE
jgi:hypothetical protein